MDSTYVPHFTCKHCGKDKSANITGVGSGMFVPCDCPEARKAWEREHRIEMERRKRLKRGGR